MSQEELLIENAKLKREIDQLKNKKLAYKGIAYSIANRNKLNFVYPYVETYKNEGYKYRRYKSNTPNDFNKLRDVAASVIDAPDEKGNFIKQNLKNASDIDLQIATNCCDELIEVICRYKKQYLELINRYDILEDFNDAIQ